MTSSATSVSLRLNWRQGLRYGLMGLPLAFVALPLYVLLPNYYARNFGVPLAGLGLLLLSARLLDAVVDPLLGRWADALFARSHKHVLACGAAAALLLGLSFGALFFPPSTTLHFLWGWALACLLVCYLAFSMLTILHQSWGALLGGDALGRSRVVAFREGLGLLGVVLASLSPVLFGMPATVALLALALVLGWWAWSRSPRPMIAVAVPNQPSELGVGLLAPWGSPAFRALLAVFMVNGIATALPATLILFFVQDRLQVPPAMEAWFLGSYFVAAALALAPWLRIVKRWGLERAWLAGMLLAVAVFAFASQLGAGDANAFLAVCVFSGMAMAADLALPGALLAGVIAQQSGAASGRFFGWWNLATKLNLALAAGVALPLLALFGYAPGSRSAEGLQALTWAYCLLPCALKLLAAGLLYFLLLRKSP
jgi:Na+/melibiose symporter-like transporter